jgi:hypothetical protein
MKLAVFSENQGTEAASYKGHFLKSGNIILQEVFNETKKPETHRTSAKRRYN